MKAFRGTLLALLLLLVLVAVVYAVRPAVFEGEAELTPRLFEFEKHELVHVEVVSPDGEVIVLKEDEGRWVIEGTDFVAGRSMVNRVKHQIHDLTARALVVESPEAPELYGLGKNAIHVTLTMRDGRTVEFLVGDPNPSFVSYYIQPLPGDAVYTVKKAAVDYYSLTLEEFRERRFASFDSKDATRIDAKLDMPDAPDRLIIDKTGEKWWEMEAPVQMTANLDRVKRLMGRVSALKAQDFIEIEQADVAAYGLDKPRADITIEFASREPLRVLVGGDAPSDNKYEELAYVMIAGESTVYVARRGMLEEFAQDPMELRNRRVLKMDETDVVAVDADLLPEELGDPEGSASVRYAAEQWVWKDGVPVPGSTPERVAQRLAELEVDAFVDDNPGDLHQYGLDEPLVRAVLTDAEGHQRVVLIGGEGEPLVDPEGHKRGRRYATIEGQDSVYLVDEGAFRVVQDMIREYNRKAKRDEEKATRRERIDSIGEEEDPLDGDGEDLGADGEGPEAPALGPEPPAPDRRLP